MNDFASRLPHTLYQQVTRDVAHHFPGPHQARRGEVLIDSNWRITADPSCGALAHLAGNDLKKTLAKVFAVKANRATRTLGITVVPGASDRDESSEVRVSAQGIRIEANSDEAAMRALFDLRWRMLNRRAPVLAKGDHRIAPAWSLRIMSPVWHRMIDRSDDYLALPDAYLLNAARYGYNATYLYADWFDFMSPATGGALARKGYRKRMADLRRTVAHLGRFGIRLLMHINTLAMPRDHRQFKQHPAMRGAQTWRDGMHCLCSSHRRTLALYRDAARQLMAEVPGLGGAVMITGGECFLHCYTRPMPQTSKGTNCPRCAKHPPEQVIAGVVNAFAQGALEADPQATLLMWPYSAFTWGDLNAQKRLIQQIDKHVGLLVSFEKDSSRTIDGVKSYVYDYSICELGPSSRYRTLHREAKRAGLKVYARTESAQSIEMFNVPRIPIMQRWADRFQAIKNMDVDGVHTAWRFYGFCAQRNDEIVYANTWQAEVDNDALLATMAARDFGPRAAGHVVRAWQQFSEGFAAFPYCAGVIGFPYFRGPFFIGPAHPFIFDTTVAHGVPDIFWTPDPSAGEGHAGADAPRAPRFFVDLTWTQPYGAQRVGDALVTVERHWRKGLTAMARASTMAHGFERTEVDAELRIATIIHCMIRTANHLVRFQTLREAVTTQPSTPGKLRRVCVEAMRIVEAEIDNARTALGLVESDPSLGYGATYGYAFTAEHLRAKIGQCHNQLEHVIPAFFDCHAFHCFGMKDRRL